LTSVRRRIGLLSGNPLCRNPRVFKEAAALARAGYDVTVLGSWGDAGVKAEDLELLAGAPYRFVAVVDATERSAAASRRRLLARVLTRLARDLHRATGRETRWQLGPSVDALDRAAHAEQFDLVIAHSEPALWAAERLLHQGTRAGVDFEDWYSEDLPPAARRSRPLRLLRRLEAALLRAGSHATCTSEAMSRALVEAYGSRPPVVVYNAFPWSERAAIDGRLVDRKDRSRPSIHWYSQSLGPGRGLEELAAALRDLDVEAEIHLRGRPVPGFLESLRSAIPEIWRARTFFHDLVPNGELLSRIAEHDLGYAGEIPISRSRDLTVTNKILHYLLAGFAVVASDTAGQREIGARSGGALALYPTGSLAGLAAAVRSLAGSPAAVRSARADAIEAAKNHFCWESQEPAFLASVQRCFQAGPGELGTGT